jgi:hydroxymethylpyrimidine pyrophosphatase-like HAD family hydrolase
MVGTLPNARAGFVPSPQSSEKFCVNITDKDASKSHALHILQDMFSVTSAETIAMGDGNNDLPLFEASGLKVAVDNASPLLKAAADIIVPSFHEHGMLQVINDHLIEKVTNYKHTI